MEKEKKRERERERERERGLEGVNYKYVSVTSRSVFLCLIYRECCNN